MINDYHKKGIGRIGTRVWKFGLNGKRADDEDDGGTVVCAPLLTATAVTEMFSDLEDLWFNCNISQAAVLELI